MDDTFSLTERASFNIENTLLQRMGRPPMSEKIHLETWEQPLSKALPKRSPGVDVDAFRTAYLPIIEEYTRSGKLEVIADDNYAALDELAELGAQLIVLTSRTHEKIQHMLEPDHILGKRVKAFYHRGNVRFRKPDPRVFDKLLKDTGLLPEQCVYVGDAIKDANAAKGAGLYFIASLESGLRKKEDFAGVPVDVFINSFPEVVSAVQTLNNLAATW